MLTMSSSMRYVFVRNKVIILMGGDEMSHGEDTIMLKPSLAWM